MFRFLTPGGLMALALLCFSFMAMAQTTYSLSGYVRDAENGEDLLGATVAVPRFGQGVVTNAYGYYSLSLPADTFTVTVSFIGFETVTRKVNLRQNQTLNFSLKPAGAELKEIEVTNEETLQQKLTSTQMSVEQVSVREARLIPAIFGEVDIIKALQLKPGVKSGGEGSSGLYVRGGGPDQNLVLLDEAPVYNAGHLFGFFSIFNPDAVRNVELYKGGFPAQYGGRLSSVVDVKLNEGNKKRIATSGGIGLISSRFTIEGPIKKDTSSFILSGRRTYFDLFTRQYNRMNEHKQDFEPIPDYYFYDLNAKVNYTLGAKDRIFLSAYYGHDVFGFSNENFNFDFNWGNITSTVRWNHIFSPKLFLNTSYIFSQYKYTIGNSREQFDFSIGSGITNHTLKTDFSYQPSNKHAVRFGAQYTYHDFAVGKLSINSNDERSNISSGSDYYASDVALYAGDDIKLAPRWNLSTGLRLSGFKRGDAVYGGLEPRLALQHNITDITSVKASYARMYQYVHLASNSGASLPTDIWYPSGEKVKPQKSDQVALGISHLFGKGNFMITNEAYYKWMDRQLDFADGANVFLNPNMESDFVFGKGWSYGNEIYLEKKSGNTTGWIGYTISWTWRQFPDINFGEKFMARYDRRHDVSVVVLHQLSKRLQLTGTWVYGTGNATSVPMARFAVQGLPGTDPVIADIYTERNTFRMEAYHRMDIGLVHKLRTKRGEADFTYGIYNVYNRRNPYFIYIEDQKDATGNYTTGFQAKQVSLFPIIPSVTYNFRF